MVRIHLGVPINQRVTRNRNPFFNLHTSYTLHTHFCFLFFFPPDLYKVCIKNQFEHLNHFLYLKKSQLSLFSHLVKREQTASKSAIVVELVEKWCDKNGY
jgi:hypothetical protein